MEGKIIRFRAWSVCTALVPYHRNTVRCQPESHSELLDEKRRTLVICTLWIGSKGIAKPDIFGNFWVVNERREGLRVKGR